MPGQPSERGETGSHPPEPRPEPSSGPSWAVMLAWIAAAFLVAGIVAFYLVRPFFAHR